MYKINRILLRIMLIVMVMTSCQKVSQQDTAVLFGPTRAIIDYFLNENKAWLSNGNQIVIVGHIEDNRSSFYLNIWDNDSSIFKPYGKYNGIVHYKGYSILLYGDSWNEFFWTCDTIYDIPDMNDPNMWGLFYDPAEWNICICCKDTSINRAESEFPDFSSLPNGEYQSILCDSLQKIIKD